MWIADKIVYRNQDNFIRAYQGSVLMWERNVPNNMIYYTSSDGQVINVTGESSYWGASIVSNTYTDGRGIITFSGPVTKIGRDRFRGQSRLTSISLPSGVTMIDNFAFYQCSGLSSIDLSYVTSFGSYVLEDCTSLSSVILNSSLTSIPTGLFTGCSGLTSVTIPSGVTSIGNEAFRNSGLIVLELPNGVTNIGDTVFAGSDLVSLTISSGVTSIGVNLCQGCEDLTEVVMYPTVPPSLGQGAFGRTSPDLLIKVPSGSVQAYQSASVWSAYASQIVSQ